MRAVRAALALALAFAPAARAQPSDSEQFGLRARATESDVSAAARVWTYGYATILLLALVVCVDALASDTGRLVFGRGPRVAHLFLVVTSQAGPAYLTELDRKTAVFFLQTPWEKGRVFFAQTSPLTELDGRRLALRGRVAVCRASDHESGWYEIAVRLGETDAKSSRTLTSFLDSFSPAGEGLNA